MKSPHPSTPKSKNKIILNAIKFLVPSQLKSIYIKLEVNDEEIFCSPNFSINKNITEIHYIFNISTDNIKTMKFSLFEKASIFSQDVLKGSSVENDFHVDEQTKSLFCFISNNLKEYMAMVYFNMDLEIEKNTFDYFQNKLKNSNNNTLPANNSKNTTSTNNTTNTNNNDIKDNDKEKKGIKGFFNSLIKKDDSINNNNNNNNKDNKETGSLEIISSLFNTNNNESSANNESQNDNKESFLFKLASFAKKDKINTANKFVKNMNYPISVLNFFSFIFTWKSYPITLTFLFTISLILLYPVYFLLLIPVLIILLHFCFRDNLKRLSLRYSNFQTLDGMNFITENMDNFNSFITVFEDIIEEFSKAEGILAEEVYFELIKISFWGLVGYMFTYVFKIETNLLLVYGVWLFALLANTNFIIFLLYMNKLTTKFIILPILQTAGNFFPKMYKKITTNTQEAIIILLKSLPIYTLIIKIKQNRFKQKTQNNSLTISNNKMFDIKEVVDTLKSAAMEKNGVISNESSIENPCLSLEQVKYELYENERWWMMVGWTKNLVLNEVPLWSDTSFIKYMDKSTVVIPSKNYDWENDWKVEFSIQSDDQGWEYAQDFKSDFTSDSFGKYVRRRKWIRVAKKKVDTTNSSNINPDITVLRSSAKKVTNIDANTTGSKVKIE